MNVAIHKRADGRYCAAVQYNGKRKFLYGRSEKEVWAKVRELDVTIATVGTIPSPGTRTVAHLIDAWLASADLRPKTLHGYRQTAALVLPHLGHLRLARLEPLHLQRLYAELGRSSKRNAYRAHLLLHKACGLAVLWGWLPSNPTDRVVKPQYRPQRKEVWSPEQLRAFLEGTASHPYGPLWTLAVCTGLRLGELLALRWADVEGDRLHVRRNLQYVDGRWVETAPKTKSGERTIVLPREGVAALKRQRALQAAQRLRAGSGWQDGDRVFTNAHGGPLQQTWVQNAMQAECRRLGLPPLTPHGLRHLHASLLLAQGLPITAVSARLGHATPSITLAVYGHALGGADHQAAEALERALQG